MGNLASTYWNQGQLQQAEKLEKKVMETRERVLGKEHPDTLTSIVNLAYTYKSRGHSEKAIAMIMDVSALRSRLLGEDHPDTRRLTNLMKKWRDEDLMSM
jgi:hypothetical protein